MSNHYRNLGKKNPFILKDSYTGEFHPVPKKVFVRALKIIQKKSKTA